MSPAPAGDLVIRPSVRYVRRLLLATPVLLLVFVAIMVLRQGVLGLGIALVLSAVILAFLALLMRRSRVIVTADQLIQVGAVGSTPVQRTEIRAVAAASATGSPAVHSLFVLDGRGETRMRLHTAQWTAEDLRRLVDALGITPLGGDRIVTTAELAEAYPRAVPRLERRPRLALFVTTGGLILLTALAIVAFSM